MIIGACRVGGAVEAGVVCGCRGTASGRARVGRHKLVGQGVLVVAVAAALSGSRRVTCHMGGIPSYKYLLPAGTKLNAVAPVWTSLVGGICRPVLGV